VLYADEAKKESFTSRRHAPVDACDLARGPVKLARARDAFLQSSRPMILLPVIERELRVTARTRRTYRNRFLAGLGMIAVLLWVLWESRGASQAQLGNETFEFITMAALILALLAGFFHTADCISEERRDGTLGLLYLTDLRSIHVIFGKLFAQSIPAFFALATIVPILAVPFLLGGITPAELQRVSLVLLNALWLSLASGVLASTLVKDDRAALVITLVLVLLPSVLGPLFGESQLGVFWVLDGATRDRDYLGGRRADFWMGMIGQFVVPCCYVALAATRARMIWREKPPTAAGAKRHARWREWLGGTAAQRKEWRAGMLEQNPALWLACRRRERTAILWTILGIGGVWLTWIWFEQRRIDEIGLVASLVFHWALKITFAFAACRAFSEEARSGAFELLFTTDLTTGQLIRGHVDGLTRSFGPAVALVVMFDALFLTFGRADALSGLRSFMWGRIGILLLDLVTIALYGIWTGYKLQRSGKAAVRALLFVVVLPNLAWVILLTGRSQYGLVFLTWFIMDAILIGIAQHNLNALRQRAAERFSASSVRE
jgi:ABC-type transport system involved in cytochrome c biogenesis permease component